MSIPHLITADNFQKAWLKASIFLSQQHWEVRNLIVNISDTTAKCDEFHDKVNNFANRLGLLPPKAVAYTIFPHTIYSKSGDAEKLFEHYNKHRGFYERKYKGYWGTYFRRMTHYKTSSGIVNQLENIINAIKERDSTHKAAYTVVIQKPEENSIIIQKPGGETVRPRGGPCLNYIAVQLEFDTIRRMGLLCVYRNHDFLERAYGNYWGLCNLLQFLAKETSSVPSTLTCISSHAYVPSNKRVFKEFLEEL